MIFDDKEIRGVCVQSSSSGVGPWSGRKGQTIMDLDPELLVRMWPAERILVRQNDPRQLLQQNVVAKLVHT